MSNKHVIGKQILEIEVNSSKRIYTMQQTMSELVWKDLLPKLNTLFDKIAGEDEVISLDRIEIDIGDINLNSRHHIDEIVNKIIELLGKKIQEALKDSNIDKDTSKIHSTDQNDDSFRTEKEGYNKKQKGNIENYLNEKRRDKRGRIDKETELEKSNRQSLRRYYFDLWLYWLENGSLPSYAIEPDQDWMPLILETLGLDVDAVTKLEKKLRKHPIALGRMVVQHIDKDLKSIVELYTGFSQAQLLNLFTEIKDLFENQLPKSTSIDYRAFEINMWQYIFEKVILERKKLESFSLGTKLVQQPAVSLFLQEKNIQKVIQSEANYPFLNSIFKKVSITHKKEELGLSKDKEDFDNLTDKEVEKENLLYNEEQLETPQFFNNAGVVLLHPFLSSFFRKLELLGENDFINFHARSKAVLLLHFLATADENPKEFEMVLPKFLCEMPVNVPLDHTIVLTKEEKDEAANLLKAVIAHWGVLGGTSPDGLREGFLMREGKLKKEQTGWKLLVEQKTLDILLDRLPWNLSLIKLPWMKEILKVEWR